MSLVALGSIPKTSKMKRRTTKEGNLYKITSESGQRLKPRAQSDQTIDVCYSDNLSTPLFCQFFLSRTYLDQNLLIQLIVGHTSA